MNFEEEGAPESLLNHKRALSKQGCVQVHFHFPLTELYLTYGRSHSIALGVYEASNLCEVAVPLADVFDAGGLHQHGVVCRQDPSDAFLVVLH